MAAPPINTPYLADSLTQLDGSKYAHSNCVLATLEELIDASSLGYWKFSVPYLRAKSGDTSGGVSYDTAIKTASTVTGGEVQIQRLYWAPENSTTSTLRAALRAKKVVGLSIDASVTRYTPYRTGTYTGGHTITVGGAPWTDSGGTERAWVMDPGHSDTKWVAWPMKLLIKAARSRTGSQSIHLMFTRDLTGVSRKATADGAVRSKPEIAKNIVSKFTAGTIMPVVTSTRGAAWTSGGRTGRGWSQIGTNKFVVGGKLR